MIALALVAIVAAVPVEEDKKDLTADETIFYRTYGYYPSTYSSYRYLPRTYSSYKYVPRSYESYKYLPTYGYDYYGYDYPLYERYIL